MKGFDDRITYIELYITADYAYSGNAAVIRYAAADYAYSGNAAVIRYAAADYAYSGNTVMIQNTATMQRMVAGMMDCLISDLIS